MFAPILLATCNRPSNLLFLLVEAVPRDDPPILRGQSSWDVGVYLGRIYDIRRLHHLLNYILVHYLLVVARHYFFHRRVPFMSVQKKDADWCSLGLPQAASVETNQRERTIIKEF